MPGLGELREYERNREVRERERHERERHERETHEREATLARARLREMERVERERQQREREARERHERELAEAKERLGRMERKERERQQAERERREGERKEETRRAQELLAAAEAARKATIVGKIKARVKAVLAQSAKDAEALARGDLGAVSDETKERIYHAIKDSMEGTTRIDVPFDGFSIEGTRTQDGTVTFSIKIPF